jgi:hypothetical protein
MTARTQYTVVSNCLVAGLLLAVLFFMDRVADEVLDMRESVDTKVTMASGKASYLPGAACVISASPEQTPADIVHFARACAKSHEIYLKEKEHEHGSTDDRR